MSQLLWMLPGPVAQRDLDLIIGLDAQIRELKAMRDAKCREIVDQMLAGRKVEPGRHSVELRATDRGPNRIHRLHIDGRKLS